MRRTLLLTCWLAPAAVASPPVADVPPPIDPVARVPAAPPTGAEVARRDALTRFGLGLIHSRNEQPAQAARQHQSAADKDPTAVAPQRELARVYAELGRDPAAIRAARQVLDRNPTDHETARLLGRLLFDARQFADAVKALRAAAADSPGSTEPVVKLAVLKELTRAADAAGDAKAGEAARRDALKLIANKKAAFLHPDVFTPAELDRERMSLYEGLGTTLVKQGSYAAASAAFQTARDLAADPKGANDPAGVARLHWHLSESLLAQGDAAASLRELEKYLAFRPAAFEPYERLVELYRRLNRAGELPQALAKQADANRKNPAPRWLAAAEGMSHDPDAADAVIRKLLGGLKTPDEARVLVAAYHNSNRSKELLDLIDRAAKAGRPAGFDDLDTKPDAEPDPPPAEAVERVRLLYAAVKAVAPKAGLTRVLVKQLADDARIQTDRHPDTLELVSGLAVRDGLAPTVIDSLWAFARRKSSLRVTWLLLTHLSSQRRWADVIDAADELKVMRRNKQQFIYYGIASQAAVAFAELGREREALAKLTDIGGGFYADEQRIRVLNLLGKHADALKAVEKVLDKDRPTGRDLRSFRLQQADTLNLLKRFAESEAVLRQLLDDDPDDVLVLNNLGYNLADQGRKLDEAEVLIRRAIELDKFERTKRGDPEAESGGYQDSLGWVLFRRGKLKEARELLEQAVVSTESAPDGIVCDHLGDVAFRQGDTKRAATAWKRAAELFKDSHLGRQNGRLDEVKRKMELAK